MPTNYLGKIIGETNVTFDLNSAQAHFDHLFLDAGGFHYLIQVHVYTYPTSIYDFVLMLDPFDVMGEKPVYANASSVTFTCRFDADYDTVVAGKEEMLKINFLNTIGPMYPNVTMSNVNVTRGRLIWYAHFFV